MSLSSRFLAYLLLVHALFAGVGLLALARPPLGWLIALETLLMLSLLLGLALLRGLQRGLAPLAEASRLLAEGDFTTRFRPVGQPEVDRLIGVYNRMSDALREERTRNQEQQGLLARILDASPSGVVILDFDERVAFANPAAGRLLGRPPGELAGQRLAGLAAPLGAALAGLAPDRGVVVALPAARRVRCQRGAFLDRGFPRGFILLEELTEELRQSEKAAYERLVRLMSHEVGNTVGAGRSLLESCLAWAARLPPDARPEAEQALGVVIGRLAQLHEFTRGFAEVVGLPPARLGDCDLGQLVRAVATLLRPAADRGGTRLVVESAEPAPRVAGDRTLLEQALLNLGKNALEAAPGGRVALRAGWRDGRALLEVEDDGCGLAPGADGQVFRPFFSTKDQGRGLGLTVVQEVLRQHRCEFALVGPPGGPTRFSALFPPEVPSGPASGR